MVTQISSRLTTLHCDLDLVSCPSTQVQEYDKTSMAYYYKIVLLVLSDVYTRIVASGHNRDLLGGELRRYLRGIYFTYYRQKL